MRLPEKIVDLRKRNGWSQEDLAENMNVSRQAISRWEGGTAQPDASNILQLSKLFGVTSDYLLNDDYSSDEDLPKVKAVRKNNLNQIMVYLITLEVMDLILQFMCVIILQNIIFGVLSFIPFVAMIGAFEYAHRKNAAGNSESTIVFRKKFYKISVWLGLYFPIRLVAKTLAHMYPRPYSPLILECVILALYIMCATLLNLEIDRKNLNNK